VSDFTELSFRHPIDVQAYVTGCPPANVAKGMFLTCMTRLAREKSGKQVGLDHYTAFKGYSMTEYLALLPECAQLAFPRVPLREALFHMGGHVYNTFAESTIGKVVMSVAGRDISAAIRLVARAYESVGSLSSVKLLEQTEHRSVIEFRNMWEYPDCYQAGVLAAGVRAYGQTPHLRVRVHSRSDVDIEVNY
jgi:uncharacterized protein (TIGR02265 family)